MFGRDNRLDPEWLGEVDFFDGFDAPTLKRLAALGERVDVEAGTVLIDQGRIGDACYVVVEGRAAVSMGGTFVAAVGPGSMVGEMALVRHKPRNAAVTAETPMVLVAFGTKEFRKLLAASPEASDRVMRLLEERAAANDNR